MKTWLLILSFLSAPAFAGNNCAHAKYTSEEYGTVAHSKQCATDLALDGKCLDFPSQADRQYLIGVIDHWGGSVEMGLCIRMNLENGALLVVDYPRYSD